MNRKPSIAIAVAATMVASLAGGAPVSTSVVGQCPANKTGINLRADPGMAAKNVTDTVLTTIDVAKEPAAIDGRSFRMRRLVVKPGGVVPWHDHAERPAIIYIVQGEMTEYASTCAVPLIHKAGEATPELHNTSHWWKNTGKTTAILISSDLLKVGDDGKMM